MTNVCVREYYDHYYLLINGHSGYAKNGEDVVCAGISTLICTLINVLADEESSGNVKLIRNIIRDGYVNLEFSCFDFSESRIKGIVDTCLTGFYMLEESYPDYIRIT